MDLTSAETILGLDPGWRMRDMEMAYEKVVAKCQPEAAAENGLTPEMAGKLEKDAKAARMFRRIFAAEGAGEATSKEAD